MLSEIIGAVDTKKLLITDVFFDCKDRVSSLTNDMGVDSDRALVRNSNDSVFYIYTKISGAWVQGDVYMTFDETNGKYFRVTNDSASMGATIFEAYSSSSHYFTPIAGDAYDDMYNGVNKYTIGAGGARQKLYNATADIAQKDYVDEQITGIQTSNVLHSVSPQQLESYRQNFIPDLPTTGSYTLKCVDGVPQWVAV
jgi:hypothetical protein